MTDDLISIIVPCYNVEKYIKRCIISIKNQTYNNIEVILVDDGSKDNTKKVIFENIDGDKRFNYLYKKNGGLSSARNFGLRHISGKYVCFVDSDDYIENDYVKELYNAIINNKVNISICDINRLYEDKNTINKMDNLMIETFKYPAAWNKMYLADLFLNNNIEFPVGKWYEDLGTTTKFLLSEEYAIVNKPLYNYIQNGSSIMHTYDDRIFDIYDIVEEIERYAKKNQLYDKEYYRIEFISIYHILIGTIYRFSFHTNFNRKGIKLICCYVENKYPKWYKNIYIKKLPLFYKIYLFCLRKHWFCLIDIVLRLLKNKIEL